MWSHETLNERGRAVLHWSLTSTGKQQRHDDGRSDGASCEERALIITLYSSGPVPQAQELASILSLVFFFDSPRDAHPHTFIACFLQKTKTRKRKNQTEKEENMKKEGSSLRRREHPQSCLSSGGCVFRERGGQGDSNS